MEKEKEKENVEVNHHQQEEEGVTTKTKTTKKKKKKMMMMNEEQENHEQEVGVTKTPTPTPTKKKKKSEEHESNEKEEGVTANTKTSTKEKKKSEEHSEKEEGVTTKTSTKEKKKSEEHESSEQEKGVAANTKTSTKEEKKSEEHGSSEQEKGVTANTNMPTKEKKKSEEHESSEQEKGVTVNTNTPTKEKKKSEEHGSSEQEKGVTANTKTNTKKKKKSEEHESSEQEKGVTANMKTPKKKKKNTTTSEEHESSELNSYSLVIALPAATATPTPTKVAAKKKIGNAVENVEEGGSVSEKKKRKSKKKGMADETDKVEDRKMELNEEESIEDLVKPKPDSKMTESCKEMGLEEKKITRKKKKKKRDENAMEVTNEFLVEGKMEVGLPTATDGDNEASSEHTKKKKKKKKKRDENAMEVTDEFLVERKMEVCLPTTTDGDNEASSEHTKKKRCLSSVTVDMEQEELEEAMRELMGKVKPASAAQTEENDMEVDTEMKKRKRKRHGSSKCTKMDTKPLEDSLQDLSVKEKPEAVQQAVEIHEEVKTGQKVMKQQFSSSENGDGNQSQLKSNLEMKVINIPGIAFLTSENHEKMSASKKKKMRKKQKKLIALNMLEKSMMELPVEGGLKASLLADENHGSAYDLSFKQPVEKSGVSSSEKPEAVQQAVEIHEEVKTGQKVMKQQLSSSENGDGNQSQLKSNLEMKVINIPGIAFLTSENHEKMSASKKRKMKKKQKNLIALKMLEKSLMELPVEGGLKASFLADENHGSAYDLSFKQPVYDLSFKQPVEKSGVSSSELLREVKTTQIVLDLPKSAPMGALFPHVGTRRKLLILDLNGLLLDIVMVVPRGYKAEKKIGPKSVFKRPFCDDFLKFCFERFEVGVWTSRTKRNMDDVLDFIMADMKHKLLFCWDQSHCTMTGINTIDNKHKPLVCKELSKLWDKHEPSLPWEKGEYNESNTLLLDDSPYKALLNPPNTAIFPNSYSLVDRNDNAIGPEGDIRLYLEGVAAAEHVQKYVKQHPFGQPAISETSSSWGFYCRVFDHFKRQLD